MNQKTVTIYIELLDEGTNVWRPVEAEQLGGDKFLIVSENPDPSNERWKFATGDTVVCKMRKLSRGNYLVAVERVPVKA